MILIMVKVDDFAIFMASLKLESELGKVVQLERLMHELEMQSEVGNEDLSWKFKDSSWKRIVLH